jgi:hypothetical protein
MATSFIEEAPAMKIVTVRLALAVGAIVSLSACSQSVLLLSPDFGDAVRGNVAGQIADPDAHYAGIPAPGSNGARVGLAQSRYEKNQVIQPSTASATSSTGGFENGTGGAPPGASGGAGVGMGGTGP